MAHEVESMMYVGDVPWHGLGTPLANVATSEEAIKAAGLDWEVNLIPVYVGGKQVEGFNAIQRVTDKKVYGIVRNRYTPVQNATAFEFFDSVVGGKKAVYHTAGSLREGARTWILAKLTDNIGIAGEQVDKYITLTNSHDGSLALQMFWTPIRVVCMNTLHMALGNIVGKVFYAKHTPRFMGKVSDAQEVLGLANSFFTKWTEEAQYLATHQLTAGQLAPVFNVAFGYAPVTPMEEVYKPIQREMVMVRRLVNEGRGMDNPKIQGTKWQAYNAIAEYVDYYKPTKSKKEGAKLNSAWFGSGMNMKQRTWDYLLNTD